MELVSRLCIQDQKLIILIRRCLWLLLKIGKILFLGLIYLIILMFTLIILEQVNVFYLNLRLYRLLFVRIFLECCLSLLLVVAVVVGYYILRFINMIIIWIVL